MESKYIRADLLMNKIAGSTFFSTAEKGKIRAVIEKEPREDVKPVAHAHWIRITRSPNEYRQCSNCHGYFTLPMPKYRGFYMRYCPSCGAKMDEEV